ncbi:MAG: DUF177 domain-containing protein [Ignavibacteriae bacterium]|jgi:uncharacterized metal-binding protein YceD (DUF177 family)|nr:MAG: DUF177 domain-containing protein [Ignavibacteriota bacterium]
MHKKGIISLSLIAIKDGDHPFEMSVDADEIKGLGDEFRGPVTVSGVMQRLGRRVHIEGTATVDAHLICDRSLEDYVEPISTTISLEYRIDNELASQQAGTMVESDEIHGIRDDHNHIDITDEVRQELILSLPMKRVAPQYRDLDLTELHPELGEVDEEPPDDRWAALKNIKP